MRPKSIIAGSIVVLLAIAATRVALGVQFVRRAEALIDSSQAPDRPTVQRVLGEPSSKTTGDAAYVGLSACRTQNTNCIIAYWYDSPAAWVYPTVWLFGFDRQGKGVVTYRFASP